MPSPALQKWIGLLEGLKHDRACLSCWLSAFQKYLTELLGFYLFFFWQFCTWGRDDNVALQVCKWSKSRTEYAHLQAICKDCGCEAQTILDMEEEEDQNARAWQVPFNIGPLVTRGDLVKTGASQVLKCTVCIKANHVYNKNPWPLAPACLYADVQIVWPDQVIKWINIQVHSWKSVFTVLACMHDSNACGNTYLNPNKELDLVYHFQQLASAFPWTFIYRSNDQLWDWEDEQSAFLGTSTSTGKWSASLYFSVLSLFCILQFDDIMGSWTYRRIKIWIWTINNMDCKDCNIKLRAYRLTKIHIHIITHTPYIPTYLSILFIWSHELQDMEKFMQEIDSMNEIPSSASSKASEEKKSRAPSMMPPPATPIKKKALHESNWVGGRG